VKDRVEWRHLLVGQSRGQLLGEVVLDLVALVGQDVRDIVDN